MPSGRARRRKPRRPLSAWSTSRRRPCTPPQFATSWPARSALALGGRPLLGMRVREKQRSQELKPKRLRKAVSFLGLNKGLLLRFDHIEAFPANACFGLENVDTLSFLRVAQQIPTEEAACPLGSSFADFVVQL